MKSFFSQISRKFGDLGTYVAPAYHHDRCERSVPMKLYGMHKRHFVVVFMSFFASLLLFFFVGLAGPSPVKTTEIDTTHGVQKGSKIVASPFILKSPLLSPYCQQLWISARLTLQQGDDEKFKKPFQVSLALYGISDENDVVFLVHNYQNYTRELHCFGIFCDDFPLLHLGTIHVSKYAIIVGFHGLQRIEENYKINDVVFSFKTYNPTFTQMEIWLRMIFLLTSFAVACWFHNCLRPFLFLDWSIEQKWVSVLLPLVVLFNDPMYPLSFLINGWFPRAVDAVFQSSYIYFILLFWLWIYHGIRQNERTFAQFYAPKLIIVGCLWLVTLAYIAWQNYSIEKDPTFDYKDEAGHLVGFKGILYTSGFIYIAYLLYLVVKAFTELHSMPYFAVRLKFCSGLVVIVLTITVALAMLQSWSTIFHIPNIWELNESSVAGASFWSHYCLMNSYIILMAFAYAPPKAACFEVRVKDNPTLSMINDSDDDVIYGSDAESYPLANLRKGQDNEESD